jgi:alkylation response protein AidB-like acyl-CoA dehydrogenase
MQAVDVNKHFFQELQQLARNDLSQAHLRQHFTAAKMFANAGNHNVTTTGTWSASKPADSLYYSDNTVTGKKHWISGVPLCNWVVVPAQSANGPVVVIIEKSYLEIESVPTLGMENTLTVHFTCKQAPATYLYQRDDPVNVLVDQFNNVAFITIQLGLSATAFSDIDIYTKHTSELDYIKRKIKLDLQVLHLLWNYELDRLNETVDWGRYSILYAFAKKTMLGVAHLVTEVTGSGLYQQDFPNHQRYKDLLIYTTHMRNFLSASKNIFTELVS